jgi:hypothetical protein
MCSPSSLIPSLSTQNAWKQWVGEDGQKIINKKISKKQTKILCHPILGLGRNFCAVEGVGKCGRPPLQISPLTRIKCGRNGGRGKGKIKKIKIRVSSNFRTWAEFSAWGGRPHRFLPPHQLSPLTLEKCMRNNEKGKVKLQKK